MAQDTLHELHRRRAGRNWGMLAVLLAFVAIMFGLAVVKIQHGDMMEGFDHQPRASMLPRDPDARPREPRQPATPGAATTGAATTGTTPAAGSAPAPATGSEATP